MTVPLRDIRQHIGQLLIAAFEGPVMPSDLREVAKEFDLGGVILFSRNIQDPEQVIDLTQNIGGLAGDLPLWISVDQEGGRVARLRAPFTEWPPMRALGRSDDRELAARFARALARELKAAGFNLNYAPVLDVWTNPQNEVIGDRALGESSDRVANLGAAIITALQQEGIAACGKHFPGHGDTVADSHHELPVVEQSMERLKAVELVPFKRAIEADVAAIMTAHVLVPKVDEERPATLSQQIVGDLLKRELSFSGLVISDDLEMRAIANMYSIGDAAVQAVAAGCDMLLISTPDQGKQVDALEALIHAVEQGNLPISRIEDAFSRQRAVKGRFFLQAADRSLERSWKRVIGCEEHLSIAEEIARWG